MLLKTNVKFNLLLFIILIFSSMGFSSCPSGQRGSYPNNPNTGCPCTYGGRCSCNEGSCECPYPSQPNH